MSTLTPIQQCALVERIMATTHRARYHFQDYAVDSFETNTWWVRCGAEGFVDAQDLLTFVAAGGLEQDWGLEWQPVPATNRVQAVTAGCVVLPGARPRALQSGSHVPMFKWSPVEGKPGTFCCTVGLAGAVVFKVYPSNAFGETRWHWVVATDFADLPRATFQFMSRHEGCVSSTDAMREAEMHWAVLTGQRSEVTE